MLPSPSIGVGATLSTRPGLSHARSPEAHPRTALFLDRCRRRLPGDLRTVCDFRVVASPPHVIYFAPSDLVRRFGEVWQWILVHALIRIRRYLYGARDIQSRPFRTTHAQRWVRSSRLQIPCLLGQGMRIAAPRYRRRLTLNQAASQVAARHSRRSRVEIAEAAF